MKPLYKLVNIKALFAGFIALSSLASCSSYQYSGYDNDGIYSSQERPGEERTTYTRDNYTQTSEDALNYKRLFAQQSEQLGAIAETGMIFTDVDSYTSTGNYDDNIYEEGSLNYRGGQPGWGDHPDEISINIYQDPFFDPWYGPTFAGFYGYGFYGTPWHGYNRFNRFGYSPWGPGFAFGNPYGPGFYTSWRWDPFWGNSWNYWRYTHHYNPYWMGGWHPGSFDHRNVAYSSSRRNSFNNVDPINTRSNAYNRSSRISDYSNARNVRETRSNRTADRTYSTRTTRVESPQSRSRRNTDVYRSSQSRSYENNTRARTTVRNTRSNSYPNTNVGRSSIPRSSGAVRSSSSSSRSSGTSSGSSRGNRGRGN